MDSLTSQAIFCVLIILNGGCHGTYNKSLYTSVEDETRLLHDLLSGYDNRVRPAMTISDTVQASFGLGLRYLMSLNEQSEYMELVFYMLTSWHDGRLSWNRTLYGGIDLVKIPAEQLWKPDIMPFPRADNEMHMMETVILVIASGHVTWLPTMSVRSPCRVNLRSFPFDQQQCSIKFASYSHHGDHLNLTYFGEGPESSLDISDYTLNANWELVDKRCKINWVKYKCCTEKYPHMFVELSFRRKSEYYVHGLVVPAIILGLLVPVTLLLPPESNERITLGSILILSILLLQAKLNDVIPASHSQLPALVMYYTLTLVWCVLTLMCSVFMHNVYNRGPRRGKVPDTVRWIFLRSLKRLVCLGSDSYYPLSDMDAISMSGLDKSPVGATTNTMHSSGSADSRVNNKMERDVEEISRKVNLMGARLTVQNARQDVLDEWRQVALVVDRVLFFFFFVVFLMCSVILLA